MMIKTLKQPQAQIYPVRETAESNIPQLAGPGQKIDETHINNETIYLVMAGQLQVRWGKSLLETADSGQFVDMLDLWDSYGSGIDVTAKTDCEFIVVQDQLAQRLEVHPPDFIVQIMRKLQAIS